MDLATTQPPVQITLRNPLGTIQMDLQLTFHLYLVLRLRMHKAVCSLPLSSWQGAKLSTQASLPLLVSFKLTVHVHCHTQDMHC